MSETNGANSCGTPGFSIIIPACNSADTLARAIESVLSQSWPAHEVIVVDDGSSDETRQVAEGFGDRIKLICQGNAGVAAARNRGAAEATGDWLAFLDADDWYYVDRLKWHAEWIVRDPQLDFLTGDYDYYQDGRVTGSSMQSHVSGRRLIERAAGELEVVMEEGDMEAFVADHFGDTHTLSVPRKTFSMLGGYPVGFKVCEDVHFLTRVCAASHRAGVICRPMAAYFIHGSSATRSDSLMAQKYNVETLLDLKRIARSFPEPVRRGVLQRLRNGRLNLAYALARTGKRREAIAAVLPSLVETPGRIAFRNLVSILRG